MHPLINNCNSNSTTCTRSPVTVPRTFPGVLGVSSSSRVTQAAGISPTLGLSHARSPRRSDNVRDLILDTVGSYLSVWRRERHLLHLREAVESIYSALSVVCDVYCTWTLQPYVSSDSRNSRAHARLAVSLITRGALHRARHTEDDDQHHVMRL